jgi:guanylate cyclase
MPVLVSRLEARISLPEDEPEARRRKLVDLGSHLAGSLATGLWAVILVKLGLFALGWLLFFMLAVLLFALALFFITRDFRLFVAIQLTVALLNPFLAQFLLGGYGLSGFVSLWALISIMGAAIYLDRRSAARWLLAFVFLAVGSGVVEPLAIERAPDISTSIRTIIFTWNGIFIGSMLFLSVQTILRETEAARDRADRLLLNILPREIAAILKDDQHIIADHFQDVSVLFADVVDFTPLSTTLSPTQLVQLLNEVFSEFDALVEKHGLEKIKTIGDCYMVAAGVPRPRPDHAIALTRLALDMRDYVQQREFHGRRLTFRIGLNSGSAIAGVIGRKKFIYDLWGDAVNTASRMESHGVGGTIQITDATHSLIDDSFECENRGAITVKGKGEMNVWSVIGPKAGPVLQPD